MTRKSWLLIVVGALLGGGAGYYFYSKSQKNKEPRFENIQVSREMLRQTVLATGLVEPQNRLELKPSVAGRVESVLVTEGKMVRKGQILAWLSSTERAAVLDAARAKGKEELERWKDIYKAAPLIAPISGLIISRKVEPGQTVSAADPILVMSDRLIVKAQVDETDIGQVKVGQMAALTLDAYAKERILGRVDHVAFEAKTVNNVTTYEVDVVPDTVPDFMKSGMTANVGFQIAGKEDALVLPAAAIQQDQNQSFVMVPALPGERKPARKDVTVGLTDGKNVEITSGLAEGDTVLMNRPDFKGKGNRQGSPFSPFGTGGHPNRPPGGGRGGG